MIVLPENSTDTAQDVARALETLIIMDNSILFVALGLSDEARLLVRLAEAQSDTGGIPGWTRKVVWVQTPEVVEAPNLAPYVQGVGINDLAFTIGYSDEAAWVFNPGNRISAGRVFLAYAAAEAQPGGTQ